ncbi:SidA/IucD/PvdA family monooxygenase [Corynebacterium sp. TAE3-ERU12]|uniref:lysine N(6)-hydroxylase/L-ornithine N(5)-oxygenase family protein n=1 Tax=Corynebacterium sp. TAE3-ERU12 TaxID=2849491 RepID=UPI001C48A8AD|nr:SidA/IucD/PvdA family monooxygenase [Corynebacterium sp. TAE3-ERU12]MBV7294625.1 SidA/IucD/PvdA family monooxygenase [Corynebacterium sp. TAE3-ERU12]
MKDVYDIVGVGIGPFNLGLAALIQPLVDGKQITAKFLDKRTKFCWHPGMMLSEATIQVPFLADLVTLADPTSPFSFLNFCKSRGNIHRFYIKEDFYPLRSEYSQYCAWVSKQLTTLSWCSKVKSVSRHTPDVWEVKYDDSSGCEQVVLASNVVIGVGTVPHVPAELSESLRFPEVIHSSEYLDHREELLEADSVTIVGSGQSAAEIYLDQMTTHAQKGTRLDWITRSPRFFPMEYTKLTLELTSPEYAAHFYSLPEAKRDKINRSQRNLYKGISADTINTIYDNLYRFDIDDGLPCSFRSSLRAGWSARWIGKSEGKCQLELIYGEDGTRIPQESDYVVLATGYGRPKVPAFLEASRPQLNFDGNERLAVGRDFSVDKSRTIFVQNAEEHTHSLNAPDLGMGPWRNSIILRSILGREVYRIERSIAFQTFGVHERYDETELRGAL